MMFHVEQRKIQIQSRYLRFFSKRDQTAPGPDPVPPSSATSPFFPPRPPRSSLQWPHPAASPDVVNPQRLCKTSKTRTGIDNFSARESAYYFPPPAIII